MKIRRRALAGPVLCRPAPLLNRPIARCRRRQTGSHGSFWAKDSQSLYHLALIVAGVIGIPLLAIRTFAANRSARAAVKAGQAALEQAKTAAERHEEQTRADRERRITESFAKAVEQLGSDKLETRLGGIYTLERIAQESEREYWPIMETLTAFVREHAPWPPRQAVANPFVELQSSSASTKARPPNSRRTRLNRRASSPAGDGHSSRPHRPRAP